MIFSETTATKKIVSLDKKIRAVCGGTSASKTISILLFLIAKCQTDKDRTLTSVVSESTPHLKRGAIRDFKNIMMGHGYWNEKNWNATDAMYSFETGSQMEFFGADQADKLRGGRRDRCFMNETNNMTLDAFDQLEVRTKEFIFLDWNPTHEFWFYTDIKPNRKDVDFLTLTYKDNEALSKEIITSIEARKNRKQWWKVYGLGELGEVEGRIYTGWAIIDEIPHEARLERYGLDFGYTNDPTAIIGLYYYNGGYIVDEIALLKGLSNKHIADILKDQENRVQVVADSVEPKSIDEIKGYGVNIVGCKKHKEKTGKQETYIKWSIARVAEQRISITKRSLNIINAYRNYMWATDRDGNFTGKPDHYLSDAMDAVRYAMVSMLSGQDNDIKEQIRAQLNRNTFRQVQNSSK